MALLACGEIPIYINNKLPPIISILSKLDSFVKFTSLYPTESQAMLIHQLIYTQNPELDSTSTIKDIKLVIMK